MPHPRAPTGGVRERQGTKSREVEARRGSGLYGDFIAAGVIGVVD